MFLKTKKKLQISGLAKTIKVEINSPGSAGNVLNYKKN